jgi:shikimate dehydrogenase
MNQLITGKTKLLGVIGDPIEHSLSPVMHNAAIASLGLNYVYVALPVKTQDLATALAGFAAIDLSGFNVTIPHKQTIMPLLYHIYPVAKMVGAVNTVWREQNTWYGTNTDVEGFIAPLKTLTRNWTEVTAVILGNGGAARAVVVGLSQLGCPEIHVVGRNIAKLDKFYRSWQDNPEIMPKLKIHPWENLKLLLPNADLLVNTTPIGMYPQNNNSPVAPDLMEKLSSSAIAYDLIYNPSPTQFLQLAQKQDAVAIDGLEMLVRQGAASLKIWLQQPIPIDIMNRSLQNYLINDR